MSGLLQVAVDIYDPFDGFNPFDVMEEHGEAIDTDSPEQSAAKVAKGMFFSKPVDFLRNSLFNAMSKHKGDPEDYMKFFDSSSTQNAINLIMSGGLSPAEMEGIDVAAFDSMNVGEVVRHRLIPEPEHALYEAYKTADPTKHPDNWIDLTHIYDARTETLYLNWAPTHGSGLNGKAIGDVYTKALTDIAEFKYNSVGGQVAAPFQNVYEVTRNKVIELLDETNPYNIVLTGHSQGASIATMAGADEIFANRHITTYAVGPGVVGDRKFLEGLNKNIGTGNIDYHRITHKKDPISFLGNFHHYSNEIWDITNDNIDPFKMFKEVEEVGFKNGLNMENLKKVAMSAQGAVMHFFGATHCASGLTESTDLIRVGDGIPSSVAKGADVYKGVKNSIIRVWQKASTATLFDVYTVGKNFIERGSFEGFNKLGTHLDSLNLVDREKISKGGKKLLTSMKRVLIKGGWDMEAGVIRENQHTKNMFKKFDNLVFRHFKFNYGPEFNSMTSGMNDTERVVFDDFINEKHGYIPFEDIRIDGVKISELSGFLDEEMIHLTDVSDDLYELKHIDEVDYKLLLDEKNIPLPKYLDKTHDLYKQSTSRAQIRIVKGVESGKQVFEDVTETLRKQFQNSVESMNLKRTKIMKEFLDKVYGDYYYTKVGDFPKPTILNNTKLGKASVQVGNFIKEHGIKIMKKTNVGGIADIGPFKKGIGELGEKGAKAAVDFLGGLLKNSGKYGKKGKAFAKKLAMYIYKEVPILSPALEIGFTAMEIKSDLDRIDNEKDYVVWNGEIIFRAYNPDEYSQLVMMELVYETNDFQGVSFDEFVNTWYGRLSSNENGVLFIDGVAVDDPNFDVVYEKSILQTRDRSDYSGESKTLSVLKNVGLGVFNLGLDLSTFVAGNTSAVGSIAIGVIDEVFEQQKISQKENGFNRALKVKMFNDSFAAYVDKLMLIDGRETDPNVKVSMNTMYSNTVRKWLTRFFRLAYLKHVEDFSSMDEDEMDATLKTAMRHLNNNGFSKEMLEEGAERFANLSDMHDHDPSMFDTMLDMTVNIGGYVGDLFIGARVHALAWGNEFSNEMKQLKSLLEISSEASDIRMKLLKKTIYNYKSTKDAFYDRDFGKRLALLKSKKDENLKTLKKMLKDKLISREGYDEMFINLTYGWLMDMKLLDASTNRYSEYAKDPAIMEIMEKYENEQLQSAIQKNISINSSLTGLLSKHSNVGDSGDLVGDMDMDILKSTIEYIVSISGNKDNSELKSFLLTRFTHEIFDKDEGDERNKNDSNANFGTFKMGRIKNPQLSEEDKAYLESFNISANDLEILNESVEDSVSLSIENSIREQYNTLTRVIDVFHDARSVYRNDPDIISYYEKLGINIDPNVRAEERITSIKEQLGEQYQSALDDIVAKFKKMVEDGEFNPDLPDFPDFPNGENPGYEKFNTMMQELNNQRTLEQEAPDLDGGNKNNVLSEVEQFDKGYADEDGEQRESFSPTGKILPYTINNGVPRMLFEDGSEKSYTGPKNALVGNVNVGFWIGPIPRGDHAPINIIDNFYMAFHIEHESDPLIARLRLMSRITKAINTKSISVDKGLNEYNIAIATLNFLEENNDIYGMDIDGVLMNDGLGAELRMQLFEVTNGNRKGALPDGVQLPKDGIELELNVENPLKRAADLAFELGDEVMGQKFRKISRERDDMERVAGEYLEEIRKLSSKEGTSVNPLQRLVLEDLTRQDSLQEKYTRLLVQSLDQKIISLI